DAGWEKIRDVLQVIGAPTTAKDLGVDDKCIIEALMKAHEIRDRYSILRDGLSKMEAMDLAEKTGVI
ncbi:MAG: NAD(P)-dependent glycerol-1-phosphate dehydrogenase, partial [Candidatus Altiarchaeota archaeon]|nr:NAD(P)-dependent glycerol-1-phosphate dehydrogenase [Candidatus Altiarchaeota archaeon]